jgi:hypothetical protein
MAPKKRAKKSSERKEEFVCPVCVLFDCLRDMTDRKSAFFQHMTNARIEFLEGIRSLIDERIEAMKKGAGKKKNKLTKIKVTD